MKGLFSVRFRITGLNAERLINEARKQGVTLGGVRREKDRTLTVDASPRNYRALAALAREKGFETGEARPLGLLRLFTRLRGRAGLWTGVLIGAALLIWSMGYIWQIRVENAGPYAGEIRLFLEENGIKPGIRKSGVELGALREALEWRLPKVKWVRAEWAGVVLRLRVEEGVPPPERDGGQAGDVVASSDGLLKRLTVYAGTPEARPGDLVRAGQVLIRGEERGKNGETVPVKARGEAMARAWITVRVRVPAVEYASFPAGRAQERRVIQTPAGSFCAEEEEGYLICETERRPTPLGGVWLPVTLVREKREAVWLEKREKDPLAVRREGEAAAWAALEKAAADQEIVDKWIQCGMIEGDHMIVTATAEIEKDLGRGRARSAP